ncbi:MAG: formylglycine-generating enzyme family protein, partial [Anaerolineae bacterium]|nr:formylglycine-generating enzyme family protein [Anaerolineae bacterium]
DTMGQRPRLPVGGAEWKQAREFCQWLGFELPAETQWEYCCRAGTTTGYWSGDTEADGRAVGWSQDDEPWMPRPVASKTVDGRRTPNPWGLYDMHGNLWEWCADLYRYEYDGSHVDGSAVLAHADTRSWDVAGHWRTHRIVRGGSWHWRLEDARSANRLGMPAGRIPGDIGFRPVLTLGSGQR